MQPGSCNANLARTLIAACNDLTAVHAALSCLVARLVDGATKGTESACEQGVEQLMKSRDEIHSSHRRTHRSGRPGKIEGNPKFEAFIRARIDTLTFAQIVSEVRCAFPSERHCSISGLSRWWKKRNLG